MVTGKSRQTRTLAAFGKRAGPGGRECSARLSPELLGVSVVGRLILFSGTSGGVGKTTVARSLHRELERRGSHAAFVPENVIFENPDLSHLAEAFVNKDFPSAEALLDGFRITFEQVLRTHDWVVHDGSWLVTGEDLPWGQESWDAIVSYGRRLWEAALEISEQPTVVYLSADVDTVLERFAGREGPERYRAWATSMRRLPAYAHIPEGGDLQVLRALIETFAGRVLDIWHAAGVPLAEVAATADPQTVTDDVLRVLASRKLTG